jgi:membrane protease subunit HflK
MRRWVPGLLGSILLLYTLATSVTQVQPGERAVVRRFGRVAATPGPGLFFGLPWGMDRVDRVQVNRVRRVVVGDPLRGAGDDDTDSRVPEGQLLTGDHNLINLQVEIYYTVQDAEVEKFVLQADRVDGLIALAAESALAEWVAGRNVDQVLLEGKAALPGWLVSEAARRLARYDLGIRFDDASVTHLYPPTEVKDAFDEVARAQTEIRTRLNRAEQEAERRVREADSEVFRMQRMTEAYCREQRLQARAEAENFTRRSNQYHELRKNNPQVLAGMWWDEMSRLFNSMRQNGRLDLLDNHLGPDGLDITQTPALPKKR